MLPTSTMLIFFKQFQSLQRHQCLFSPRLSVFTISSLSRKNTGDSVSHFLSYCNWNSCSILLMFPSLNAPFSSLSSIGAYSTRDGYKALVGQAQKYETDTIFYARKRLTRKWQEQIIRKTKIKTGRDRNKHHINLSKLNIYFVAHKTHSASVTKNQSVNVCREISTVYSKIHTQHTNTVCGQNVEFLQLHIVWRIVTTGPWWVNIVTGRFQFICSDCHSQCYEKQLLFMSVRPLTRNNSASTGRILLNFILERYTKLRREN
jgi:hypothetical protein